jgi:hypothetical protein
VESFALLLVLLLSGVVFGLTAQSIAVNKGHGSGYLWLGFFFGPLGIIAVAALPDNVSRNYLRAIAEKLNADVSSISRYRH